MAKRKTLGVGVVGTGWVAGAHVENFQQIEGCEIVAMCSRSKKRAQERIDELGLGGTKAKAGATAYGKYDAMLNHDGLDIVAICTPHPNHPAETIKAAKAAKHIVIEKPVAMNRLDLRKMVAAVKKAKVKTSVCFELRFGGLFKNLSAIIEQGLLGEIYYAESSYYHGIGPWYKQWEWNIKKRMGGDALLTAGCHALDALIALMGSRVTEVAAMSNTSKNNPLKYEYDPNSVAILKFASGAIGKVATSIECRQPYYFPIMLQGEKGTVRNEKISTTQWPGLKAGQWATIPTVLPDSGDVSDHPYLGQLQYFVDCIRSRKRPTNDLAACSHVHEVMFAIDKAIKSRKTVKVPRTPGA